MNELATSMSAAGQTGGAGQGNSNLQGMTPARMPERPPQLNPLAASAEARGRALDQMAAGGQQLASTRANTSAHFQQRQAAASAGMATPSGTGNGIGPSTGALSMNGILRGSPMHPSSGLGSSAGTFANTKWSGQ